MTTKQKLTDDGQWLMKETRRIIEGCKVTAFDGITVCFTPDASAFYKAMWTRDFFYMVDGVPECATDEEVHNACTYLLNGQREDGVIPDRRDADGVSIYSAGPYGKKLGLPPADNAQFMVKLVYHYVMRTGNINYFRIISDCLERALGSLVKSDNGLVYISPSVKRSSFGFIDQIDLSGNVLFSSLLLIEAEKHMQEMYAMAGQDERAEDWRHQFEISLKGLETLWCEEEGLYFASSEKDRQLSIWGSCYTAYAGFCSDARAEAISRRIVKDYQKAVRFGQVRHLFYPDVWKNKIGLLTEDGEFSPKPGTYQNGAYWSSASGWVSAVIRLTNETLANEMLADLLKSFRAGVCEAINDDPVYRGAEDYCISATLVIQELRRIGIDTGVYGNGDQNESLLGSDKKK
jgi:hypothetical protein